METATPTRLEMIAAIIALDPSLKPESFKKRGAEELRTRLTRLREKLAHPVKPGSLAAAAETDRGPATPVVEPVLKLDGRMKSIPLREEDRVAVAPEPVDPAIAEKAEKAAKDAEFAAEYARLEAEEAARNLTAAVDANTPPVVGIVEAAPEPVKTAEHKAADAAIVEASAGILAPDVIEAKPARVPTSFENEARAVDRAVAAAEPLPATEEEIKAMKELKRNLPELRAYRAKAKITFEKTQLVRAACPHLTGADLINATRRVQVEEDGSLTLPPDMKAVAETSEAGVALTPEINVEVRERIRILTKSGVPAEKAVNQAYRERNIRKQNAAERAAEEKERAQRQESAKKAERKHLTRKPDAETAERPSERAMRTSAERKVLIPRPVTTGTPERKVLTVRPVGKSAVVKVMSCMDAAAKVLEGSKKPLTFAEVLKRMADQGLWSTDVEPVQMAKNIGMRMKRENDLGKNPRFILHGDGTASRA